MYAINRHVKINTRACPGFTIVELMIVLVLVGIIGVLSIPSYFHSIARSQVGEAFALTAAMKTPVVEWINDHDSLPQATAAVSANSSGKYVASVTVEGSRDEPRIVARMKQSGVSHSIQGLLFVLSTNDGGKIWHCKFSTIPSNYLPASCSTQN
jgi:prepilin-type N-terminal cleavage/methylation domain-containing protein